MAIIPAEEKVFMVSNSTNTTYSGSAALKAMQQWYTMEDVTNTVRPYQVFTALLTQSGESAEIYVENFSTSGAQNIVKGTSYFIDINSENVDFSSIGAPSNVVGTNFIATVDKLNTDFPDTTWALVYNAGAPVATVLENTIGNVWFSYNYIGNYACNSNSLFTNNKSTIVIGNLNWDGGFGIIKSGFDGTTYAVIVTANMEGTAPIDNVLYNMPIEIRVYN
jgi:hypothetical protein